MAGERGPAPGRPSATVRVRADPSALARARRRVVGGAGLSREDWLARSRGAARRSIHDRPVAQCVLAGHAEQTTPSICEKVSAEDDDGGRSLPPPCQVAIGAEAVGEDLLQPQKRGTDAELPTLDFVTRT